jgi:uncharacterized protein YecE (DUF72 family)
LHHNSATSSDPDNHRVGPAAYDVSMPNVFAGTSGFAYPSWKPDFYPADLPAKKFLQYYATRLNSTEINYTFMRLPAEKSLAEWVQATPPGFVFSLKAHRRITHMNRLKGCESFLEAFLKAIDPLRVVGRLGVVLFQLPPSFKLDLERLRDFVALLPGDIRFAFEFRHESWLSQPVYDVLGDRRICLCLAESERLVVPEVITAPFVYFRLRKPEYDEAERAAIAARICALDVDSFVYFKHEDSPAGAVYAEELIQACAIHHRLSGDSTYGEQTA